ncbi:hypothetical protein FHG87_012709, partial [Trinorchestia longiramus]
VNETLNKHHLSNGLCGASAAGGAANPHPPSSEVPLSGVSVVGAVGTSVHPPLQEGHVGDCPDPGVTDDQYFSSSYTSESKPLLVALRKTPADEGGSTPSITSILTRQIAAWTRAATAAWTRAATAAWTRAATAAWTRAATAAWTRAATAAWTRAATAAL